MKPLVETGPPLSSKDGKAIAYGVLAASFYLESLTHADEGVLAQVNALAMEWIGGALRWTTTSATHKTQPFEPSDLEMVKLLPRQLVSPIAGKNVPPLVSSLAASATARFYVACSGASKSTEASSYSYRFTSVIPKPGPEPVFGTASSLFLSVPATWPLDDFYRRVWAIAARLRLRWGAAGLAYSTWEFVGRNAPREAVYAHARRHCGFDVVLDSGLLPAWHDQIRTVNWLTFLGPSFVERLESAGSRLEDSPLVRVSKLGDTTLLVAGDRPMPGDINRRQLPPAYVAADAMVRPIRASKGLHFLHPWTEATTEQWLRRFELQLD